LDQVVSNIYALARHAERKSFKSGEALPKLVNKAPKSRSMIVLPPHQQNGIGNTSAGDLSVPSSSSSLSYSANVISSASTAASQTVSKASRSVIDYYRKQQVQSEIEKQQELNDYKERATIPIVTVTSTSSPTAPVASMSLSAPAVSHTRTRSAGSTREALARASAGVAGSAVASVISAIVSPPTGRGKENEVQSPPSVTIKSPVIATVTIPDKKIENKEPPSPRTAAAVASAVLSASGGAIPVLKLSTTAATAIPVEEPVVVASYKRPESLKKRLQQLKKQEKQEKQRKKQKEKDKLKDDDEDDDEDEDDDNKTSKKSNSTTTTITSGSSTMASGVGKQITYVGESFSRLLIIQSVVFMVVALCMRSVFTSSISTSSLFVTNLRMELAFMSIILLIVGVFVFPILSASHSAIKFIFQGSLLGLSYLNVVSHFVGGLGTDFEWVGLAVSGLSSLLGLSVVCLLVSVLYSSVRTPTSKIKTS